jgi:hypothetical protein
VVSGFQTIDDAAKTIVCRSLKRVTDQVVVGPIVWQTGSDDERQWYFTIVTADKDGFGVDQVSCGDDRGLAEQTRVAVLFAFIQKKPIVVHDCDDELRMARLSNAIWPCAKGRRLIAEIEAERAMVAEV